MRHELIYSIRSFLRYSARRFRDPVKRRRFTVTCRCCRRVVPIGRKEFPFHSVPIICRLCGETYSYRPSEIALRLPHALVRQQDRLELRRKRRPRNHAGLPIVPVRESCDDNMRLG
jgi:hypothetical protein